MTTYSVFGFVWETLLSATTSLGHLVTHDFITFRSFKFKNSACLDTSPNQIQMKLILLCIWAEPAVLGSAKAALKFKY